MPISRRNFMILGAVTATAFAMPPFISLKAYAASLEQPAMSKVTLQVNGKPQTLEVDTRTTLLDALREHLHLTGTKKGCDHGQCGACTVIADGRRINSCLTLAVMHDGSEVTTIEGLGMPDKLHPMQAAFIKHDGYQCGYCTPGQICSAVGLANEGRACTPDQIKELMSGNLCRCGAYSNIRDAIEEALPDCRQRSQQGGAQ